MTPYGDLLQAELSLFGDCTHSLSIRNGTGGGADVLDDMAQAWLDGDHDRVNTWVADREAKLRSVKVTVPTPVIRNRRDRGKGLRKWGPYHPVIDRNKILELRSKNWKLREIAKSMKCSVSHVSQVCRSATMSASGTSTAPLSASITKATPSFSPTTPAVWVHSSGRTAA